MYTLVAPRPPASVFLICFVPPPRKGRGRSLPPPPLLFAAAVHPIHPLPLLLSSLSFSSPPRPPPSCIYKTQAPRMRSYPTALSFLETATSRPPTHARRWHAAPKKGHNLPTPQEAHLPTHSKVQGGLNADQRHVVLVHRLDINVVAPGRGNGGQSHVQPVRHRAGVGRAREAKEVHGAGIERQRDRLVPAGVACGGWVGG